MKISNSSFVRWVASKLLTKFLGFKIDVRGIGFSLDQINPYNDDGDCMGHVELTFTAKESSIKDFILQKLHYGGKDDA